MRFHRLDNGRTYDEEGNCGLYWFLLVRSLGGRVHISSRASPSLVSGAMWNRKWENTEQYEQKKFWICFRNLRFNKFQLQCPAIWGWPELCRGVRKVLLRQLWALASFQWRVSGPFLFIPGQLIDLCGKRGFMSSSSNSGPNFLYGQLTYRLLWAWH